MKHVLITILMLVIPFTSAFMVAGCAQHKSKDSLTLYQGGEVAAEYDSEVVQNLILYKSEGFLYERRTHLADVSIGRLASVPDANSVKAVVAGVGEWMKVGGL
jgi:hypothetical protein